MAIQLSDQSASVLPTPHRMVPRDTSALFRFMPGTSRDLSRRNLFNPDAPGAITGSPTYSASPMFANFRNNADWLDTGANFSGDDFTVFAVVKSTSEFSGGVYPNFLGNAALSPTTGAGFGIYVAGTPSAAPIGRVRLGAYVDAGAGNSPVLVAASLDFNISNWNLVVAQFKGGVGVTFMNKTTGQSAAVADTRSRVRNASTPIRLGAMQSTAASKSDIALAEGYNSTLGATLIDSICGDIRAVLAARGITGI